MREHTALAHSPEGYLDFHDEYRGLIAELASLGFTPTQVHRRLRFLYPSLNQLHLDYALNSGIWQFGPVTADAPSHLVLACGLWYIFAEAYDLPPEHEYATLLLDSDIIHDLPPALEARHIWARGHCHNFGKDWCIVQVFGSPPLLTAGRGFLHPDC